MNCACGNTARYIAETGELCCGICPIKNGHDAIKIASVPDLLAVARRIAASDSTYADEIRHVIGKVPIKES